LTHPVKRAISLAVATFVAVPLAISAAFSVAATNATPTYDVETNDDGSQIFTQSIAAALDGSVYVVGGFNSYDASPNPAVFGSTSLYNAGGTDYEGYVAKLGPDGVWDWAFRAGAIYSGEDRVVDVVALDDGGAIVLIDASYDMTVSPVTGSGEFSTTGDTSVLVRVAADGSFVWHKEMTGSIPVSQELSLSADQQTVVALAVGGDTIHVEAFNASTGASIWTRSIEGSGTIDSVWGHMELAVNNAGTVVASWSFYGGTYVVDNVVYDSTYGNNEANGAMQSLFAAFDITDGSTDWVAYTRKSSTGFTTQAEAHMFELEAAGDKFLAVMLVGEGDGIVQLLDGNGAVDLQYWDYGYVVVELSDTGSWVEKTRLSTCDGYGCTLDSNYMNLLGNDDGSFDLWYLADSDSTSLAWMDYLHPDDHMVLASFNADGTGEKLTSFTGGGGHRPGYQNAIDSFDDGSLVIAGQLNSALTDGSGNTVSGLPGRVFVAPLDNGTWTYNTATPPSYTISYDANGGTGAPADQTCVAGSTVTLSMTEPTRAGYTFLSWTTGGMFPPSIAPGSTRECADTALYAQWEEMVDADNDGLDSTLDPDDNDPDIDGDGVLDGAEQGSTCITSTDCDSDGLTDDLDADDLDSDQDDDGVLDGAEEDSSCVTKADCDDDGLADAVDADDLDSDQDDDSVLDGAEEDSSCVTNADCDDDGLADAVDTDDLDSDQDNDGVLDGAENDGCVTDPAADCGTVTSTTVPGDSSTTTTTTITSVPESSTTTTSTPATTETSVAPDTTGGEATTTSTTLVTSSGETTTTVVLEATIGESTTTSEPFTLPATGGDNRMMPAVILLMCVGVGLVLVRRRHIFID
jgi:uncharacterized repeat protein (TIGR02543 family)